MAVSRIVEAIICDEHSVLTVSSCLSGAYGLEDVALSLPCVITKNGIDRIINLCLSAKETADLRHSAKSLKDVIAQVYNRDVDTVLAGV